MLSAVAGFFLASRGHINLTLLLGLVCGTSLITASACVFNNYLDRQIDQAMDRTKKRALVSGKISLEHALAFATALGFLGFIVLDLDTNLLTVVLGAIGIFFYVVVYGIAKRKSVHGTLVGSISGATPLMAGYTAASGRLDLETWLLFLTLVFWQMPHFYAIAVYRFKDYKRAGIPVLPVVKGMFITKLQILSYTVAFVITALSLTVFGFTGYIYFVVLGILGGYWVGLGVKGFRTPDEKVWARKMFGLSLVVMLVLSIMLSVSGFLPKGT